MVRIAIPTKDRPGNVALAVSNAAMQLRSGDDLVLYDDGHRPASSDYATRFGLDIALQLGASVEIKRGKPAGIAFARAKILKDALADDIRFLFMIDDDILITQSVYKAMLDVLHTKPEAQYAVPIIGLANNEAGVERFGDVPEATSTHNQQFVLNGSGIHRIQGGAWTCAILMDLHSFDVEKSISSLINGPSVVEDYVLTNPLIGYVDRSALCWHVMTPDQGLRDWNGKALAYLRKTLGDSNAI